MLHHRCYYMLGQSCTAPGRALGLTGQTEHLWAPWWDGGVWLVVKHWLRMPWLDLNAPSLQTSKVRLNRILRNLIKSKVPPFLAGVWTRWPLKAPFQHKLLFEFHAGQVCRTRSEGTEQPLQGWCTTLLAKPACWLDRAGWGWGTTGSEWWIPRAPCGPGSQTRSHTDTGVQPSTLYLTLNLHVNAKLEVITQSP